jgi:hypothetical protein
MSKNDLIGSLTRALVSVPYARQGVLLDIINRLGKDSPNGGEWSRYFADVINNGLSKGGVPTSTTYSWNKILRLTEASTTVGPSVFKVPEACFQNQVQFQLLEPGFGSWWRYTPQSDASLSTKREFSIWELTKPASAVEVVSGLTNATSISTVRDRLTCEAHVVTLAEIEDLVLERPGLGAVLGLDGQHNYFFVETHERMIEGIAMVRLTLDEGRWLVCPRRIVERYELEAGSRVFGRKMPRPTP